MYKINQSSVSDTLRNKKKINHFFFQRNSLRTNPFDDKLANRYLRPDAKEPT